MEPTTTTTTPRLKQIKNICIQTAQSVNTWDWSQPARSRLKTPTVCGISITNIKYLYFHFMHRNYSFLERSPRFILVQWIQLTAEINICLERDLISTDRLSLACDSSRVSEVWLLCNFVGPGPNKEIRMQPDNLPPTTLELRTFFLYPTAY